jgi:hypothetical protein
MAVLPMTKGKRPTFSKVYRPRGWDSIRQMADNPLALKLYSFLCTHCDHLNAVCASIDLLAEELGCHERSIRRAVRWLEDNNHLTVVKIGTANCYVINPEEVLHNLDKYKGYVTMSSKALAKKDATLRKRLTYLVQGQKDLFDEDDEDAEAGNGEKDSPS